jgi:hypothetical protein
MPIYKSLTNRFETDASLNFIEKVNFYLRKNRVRVREKKQCVYVVREIIGVHFESLT